MMIFEDSGYERHTGGRVYDKIVMRQGSGYAAVAFIDRATNAWYPADGWSRPNKRRRLDGGQRAALNIAVARTQRVDAARAALPMGRRCHRPMCPHAATCTAVLAEGMPAGTAPVPACAAHGRELVAQGRGWELTELAALPEPGAPRVDVAATAAGIVLVVDGRPVDHPTLARPRGVLVDLPRRKRDVEALLALLREAARLGAAHGACDRQAELAEALGGAPAPAGHVIYGRRPVDGAVTQLLGGVETALQVPAGLAPAYLLGQLANALDTVFRLAGQLAADEAAQLA